MCRALFCFLIALLLSQPVTADWTQLGNGGGGQIRTIKSNPNDPSRVYIGSDVAGLWRTTTGAGAFSGDPEYEYLTKGWSVRFCQDIAFDNESDPYGIFIACQTGVFYSADDGVTWSRVGSEADNERIMDVPKTSEGASGLSKVSAISVVRYDNGNKLRIYAGVGNHIAKSGQLSHATRNIWIYDCEPGSGNPLADDDLNGAWNNSELVTQVADPNWKATIYKIVANPANKDQVWVSTEDGVFYTSVGGSSSSWTKRDSGLDSNNLHCRDLVVNPDNFENDARVMVKGIHYKDNALDKFLEPSPSSDPADPDYSVPGGYYRWKEDPNNPNNYKWFRVQNVLQYFDSNGSPSPFATDSITEWSSIAIDELSTTNDPENYVGNGNEPWGNYVFIGADIDRKPKTVSPASILYSYNGNRTVNGSNGSDWTTRAGTGSISDTGWQTSSPLICNPHALNYHYDADYSPNGRGRLWVGKSGSFFRSNADITDTNSYVWRQEYTTQNNTNNEWVNRGLINTTVRGVSIKPDNPNRIFTAQADRGISRSIYSSGIYYFESQKAGMKVTLGNGGTPQAGDGFFIEFPIVNDNLTAFASANNSTAGEAGVSGLYISEDGGDSWSLIAGGIELDSTPNGGLYSDGLEYWDITAIPDDANSKLWLATVKKGSDPDKSGVYESPKAGNSWSQVIIGNGSLEGEAVTNIQAIPQGANPYSADEEVRLIIGTQGGTQAGIWVAVDPATGGSTSKYTDPSENWTNTTDGWYVKKVVSGVGLCSDIAIYADDANDAVTVLVATKAGMFVSVDVGDTYVDVNSATSEIDPVLPGKGQLGVGGVAVDDGPTDRIAYAIRDGDFDQTGPGNFSSNSPQLYACNFTSDVNRLMNNGYWVPLAPGDQPLNRRTWNMKVDEGTGRVFVATRGTGVLMHDRFSVSEPLKGDLNRDGFVGIADLNIVLGNWNQNVLLGFWEKGDPSGDGFVGIADLNEVLGNWNAGTPPTF